MSSAEISLTDVRKELKISWYRSPVKPEVLRELTKRSDLQGWCQAFGHFALFLATGVLTFWMWSRQIWIGFAIGMFLHGTVASFFNGTGPHELAHGTVFRTKGLNKLFLYLFSLISWWDPFDYAMSHTYHHRYTLFPKADQENVLPLTPSLRVTTLIQMFTVDLFSRPGRSFGKGGLISTVFHTARAALGIRDTSKVVSRTWLRALHADQPKEAKKSMWWSRAQILFHIAVLAFSILSGYWIFSLLISVAPLTGRWATYFVGVPQHCGLRENVPDFRKCVRSMKLSPILTFLYWRMNWHAEHHMYAAAPCYRLKRLASVIADDMPQPKSLIGAWKEMRGIWRRQLTEPDYQYDIPLPPSATAEGGAVGGTSAKVASSELEKSIGDLAPQGLA